MTFSNDWSYPEGHPISPERAQALLKGDLGTAYLQILKGACAPIYWHATGIDGQRSVCANGTITFVRTPQRTFGITANHVLEAYEADAGSDDLQLQIFNTVYIPHVIARSAQLDLVTLDIPDNVLASMGKDITPVSLPRPRDETQEGRGIMICGYVGGERREHAPLVVEWGMLGVVGIARRVTERQISWSPDHEHHVQIDGLPKLAPNKDLGGISGGPLIAWFEKANGRLAYYSLAGIIVEASAEIENVIAIRSEYIREDGSLRPF